MAASDSLASTVRSITAVKRRELAKQQAACDVLRDTLVKAADNETGARARLRTLLKDAGKLHAPHGLEDVTGDAVPKRVAIDPAYLVRRSESAQHDEILSLAGISAPNVQRFLDQAEHDDSIPDAYFEKIEKQFRHALRALETKYQFAKLFSDIVVEAAEEPAVTAEDCPEIVGRQEMHDQRKEWESLVFSADDLDTENIASELAAVFARPEAKHALDDLRKGAAALCLRIQKDDISTDKMKLLVDGLIATDVLSDEQTATLKQVRENTFWLNEMVDVLHLRLQSIERWSWETEAMPVEVRRQMNGKYRFFVHEDITQALLIHHIGIKFATGFGDLLDKFYAKGWKQAKGVGAADSARWDYFIGDRCGKKTSTIRKDLEEDFKQSYYMSALPRTENEALGNNYDEPAGESRVAKSIEAKQAVLHKMVAESLLADELDEELVVVQTDFRWFGPSLAHSTIAAVTKFLGVTEVWRGFFAKFLAAPMRFLADGPAGEVRTRRCGVPMSHVLSTYFNEMTLFCVDHAVNESTDGKPMYRLHDDIWMWGTANETTAAWRALTKLTGMLGIAINEEKTGSVRLTQRPQEAVKPLPADLPFGSLTWGLLTVQPGGQFRIDQSKIDEHVVEIRRQLAARNTVIGWIQAYNSYVRFFELHFCRPENALGREHVDDCLRTFSRINRQLCPATDGDIGRYVQGMIAARFNARDVPRGFLFFPMAFGGLALENPFIKLQALRNLMYARPADRVAMALDREELAYRKAREQFDEHGPNNERALRDGPAAFMTRAEFALHRRDRSLDFSAAWDNLVDTQDRDEDMAEGDGELLELSAALSIMLENIKSAAEVEARAFATQAAEPYWRAVLELYGPEMGEVFGGVQVVAKGLLPAGLCDLIKGKVRWES